MKKVHLDVNLLKQLINENKTAKEVAVLLNTTATIVRKRAKEIGLPYCKELLEHPKKINQFIGQKLGRLTIIKFVRYDKRANNTGRESIWECKCDCGKIIQAINSRLTAKMVTSCGCSQKDALIKLHKGNIKQNASFYAVMKDYERGAKSRQFEFNITEQEFRVLTSSDCFYCGQSPSKTKAKNGAAIYKGKTYTYNGIDRVDNKKGYYLENCVSCCFTCNMMKGKIKKEDFLLKINQIYEFQINKNE